MWGTAESQTVVPWVGAPWGCREGETEAEITQHRQGAQGVLIHQQQSSALSCPTATGCTKVCPSSPWVSKQG